MASQPLSTTGFCIPGHTCSIIEGLCTESLPGARSVLGPLGFLHCRSWENVLSGVRGWVQGGRHREMGGLGVQDAAGPPCLPTLRLRPHSKVMPNDPHCCTVPCLACGGSFDYDEVLLL